MRSVFAGIVDYAGLFPPASCSTELAIRQYDEYRRSDDRWLLGRFVCGAIRLGDFSETLESTGIVIDPADPWRISAVMGVDIALELERIDAFRAAWDSRGVLVDSIEYKVTSPGHAQVAAQQIPSSYHRYFEVPQEGEYGRLVAAIARYGAMAKIRTGGTTADLFPSPAQLTAFLVAVTSQVLPFKATAGLHHPFRGEYPLTYKPDSEQQVMHGFINLFVAVTELVRGGDAATAQMILEELDSSAFQLDDDGINWRDRRYSAAELADAHARVFVGFGSCSFREPVAGLGLGVAA